jgi:protein-disulfide isomerase
VTAFAVETSDRPLFRYDGTDIHESQLPPALRQALFRLQAETYRNQSSLLDAALLQIYLEQEAKGKNRAPHELELELFPSEEPTEEQVEQFYEANRNRIAYPLEEVRGRIIEILSDQDVNQQKQAFIGGLKEVGDFELLLERPVPPQIEIAVRGRPIKGDPEAPVTLVEFADFQCPHCRRASPVLEAIIERYPGKVKLIYMDFPINPSGISRTVSLGAVCAAEQDEFWAYHDLAFERQETLSNDSPLELAATLGLDQERFRDCFESDEAMIKLGLSKAEGDRVGIAGTPTLFVNGRELLFEDLETDLAAAIEAALAGSS